MVRDREGLPRVPGVAAVVVDRDGEVYAGGAGERVAGSGAAFDPDTVVSIYSVTKSLTATAALQLIEEGVLDLDTPASLYVPEIASIPVYDGVDEQGHLKLRAPKRAITVRHLLTHTAGFSYDFFSPEMRDHQAERGAPSPFTARRASLERQFLLFDPGEKWMYGTSMDWMGLVIEAARGQSLEDVFRERIFEPLGMVDSSFRVSPSARRRLARIHMRREAALAMPDLGAANGQVAASNLSADPAFALHPLLSEDPEIYCGGHGVLTTPRQYAKFLRAWLNDGQGDHGRILRRETIEFATRGHLEGEQKVGVLPDAIPSLTNAAGFFPDLPNNWALSFYRNEEDAPTGRSAGSIGWAGLPNLYYWIDRTKGVAGIWATQVFPFADATSFTGYAELETATYDSLRA